MRPTLSKSDAPHHAAPCATLLPGDLTVTREPGSPLVVVTGSGLWSVEQMIAHLDEYQDMLRTSRWGGLGAVVLVLLEDTAVQLPAVTGVLMERLAYCHQPEDRIAMLVPGALARIQMRRVLDTGNHEFFATEAEARAWLNQQPALLRSKG